MDVRRVPAIALALLLFAAVPASPATSAVPATTQVGDVRGVKSSSGSKSMVTYEVTHDFGGHVDPFTALPGAVVPSSEAFDGSDEPSVVAREHVFHGARSGPFLARIALDGPA